jgi:hypothetical protein
MMIGKIIGALAGSRIAKSSRDIDGPAGAALGVAAATVLRRASVPAVVAMAAGGYFLKRYMAGRKGETGRHGRAY